MILNRVFSIGIGLIITGISLFVFVEEAQVSMVRYWYIFPTSLIMLGIVPMTVGLQDMIKQKKYYPITLSEDCEQK